MTCYVNFTLRYEQHITNQFQILLYIKNEIILSYQSGKYQGHHESNFRYRDLQMRVSRCNCVYLLFLL